MLTSVREKADMVATWRHTAVFVMETLARWVPTTPELEAKALFGRHIWDFAQLADQLGRRTAELRLALHQNRAPLESYQQALQRVAATTATGDRIAVFYDVMVPDLAGRLEKFLSTADPILDDPTSRIAERGRTDMQRMLSQRDGVLAERPDLKAFDRDAVHEVRDALRAIEDCVDYRPAPADVA